MKCTMLLTYSILLVLFSSATAYGEPICDYEDRFQSLEFIPDTVPQQRYVEADLNRDGIPDLVSLHNEVLVYLGQESGGLQSAVSYPTASDCHQGVFVTDWDMDGWDDVMVVCYQRDALELLLNDGTGHLVATGQFFPAGRDPVYAYPVDFNMDGQNDYAVHHALGRRLELFEHLEDGTSARTGWLQMSGYLTSSRSDDLDLDGDIDFVVSSRSEDEVRVFLQAGDGSFVEDATYEIESAGVLVLADLNNDSYADLAVGSRDAGRLTILENDGLGGFSETDRFELGYEVEHVEAFDPDRDGDTDLVVRLETDDFANPEIDALLVFENDGAGVFTQTRRAYVGLGTVYHMTAFDYDRNGWDDLLIGDQWLGMTRVMLNESGTLPDIERTSVGYFTQQVFPLQLDADDALELIVKTGDALLSIDRDSEGRFLVLDEMRFGRGAYELQFGDLNGDGTLDTVVSNLDDDDLSIHLGEGGGLFGDEIRLQTGAGPRTIGIGDFDRDGLDDIVVVRYWAEDVMVYYSDGSGGYGATSRIAYDGTPNQVRPDGVGVKDFDGDGHLDVVVGVRGRLDLYRGDGSRGFTAPVVEQDGFGFDYSRMRPVDFDGDGDADLIVFGLYQSGDVRLFENDGQGLFSVFQSFDFEIEQFHFMDFDSDGIDDFVFVGYEIGVEVWSVTCSGSFERLAKYEYLTSGVSGAAFVDLDNDGPLDLVWSAGVSLFGFKASCTIDDACPVDLSTPAGVLNYFDVAQFMAYYLSGHPLADINGDGILGVTDVFTFLQLYQIGC